MENWQTSSDDEDAANQEDANEDNLVMKLLNTDTDDECDADDEVPISPITPDSGMYIQPLSTGQF